MPRLSDYRADRLAFFAACADESGAAVRCRLGGDGYVLNAADDIRHVLVTGTANYVKSRRASGPRAAYPRANTLLTSAGEEHRRRRRTMQPAFRQALVETVKVRARENSRRLATAWGDGAEVDMHAEMVRLARRNILETLLGPTSEERLEALAAATAARRRAFENLFFSLFPLPEYVPSRVNRRHRQATRALRAAIDEEIAERRARPRQPADLLSLLMDMPLSDREVADEALTISLTGYDSVGEGLAWTFHLLARHPEVDAAVADEASGGGELQYTTSVVRESLRLFPPTWLFVRIARGDDRLPSGTEVRAGAKVYVCPYIVHHSPRYWPDPDTFLPERFAAGTRNGRPRYAFLPFGGGPHVCIGESLAMAQIVTVVAEVAAAYRLAPADAAEVEPEGGLTLRPKGGVLLRALARS
jgi:cytochrome P450